MAVSRNHLFIMLNIRHWYWMDGSVINLNVAGRFGEVKSPNRKLEI